MPSEPANGSSGDANSQFGKALKFIREFPTKEDLGVTNLPVGLSDVEALGKNLDKLHDPSRTTTRLGSCQSEPYGKRRSSS